MDLNVKPKDMEVDEFGGWLKKELGFDDKIVDILKG